MARADHKRDDGTAAPSPGGDYVRMYYQHQYDRFARLEGYGFTVSNFAIGVSLVALGLMLDDTGLRVDPQGRALAAVTVVVNLVAAVYLLRVHRAKRAHQDRAKAVLRRWAPALLEIDRAYPQPDPRYFIKRSFIQGLLHAALVVSAVFLLL